MYDYFGDIVCINLMSRPDRKRHAVAVFGELGIPVRFFPAEIDPQGGIVGCFKSHISIIQEAVRRDLDNVLVFEDDVISTTSYSAESMREAIRFMKESQTWDIFHFGYFCYNTDPLDVYMFANTQKMGKRMIARYNPLGAHAYCVSRRGMNKMLTQDWSNYIGHMHVDVFYANHAGLVNYCIVPMVFNQKMCLESNIKATNVIERIMRSVQCVAVDKLQVMYVLSLIKHVVFEMCCSVVFIAVFITIYWLFKSSKSASFESANKTYRQRKL